jgi:hypothetical protein
MGDTSQQVEIGFRDAKGGVDLARVAPVGEPAAAMQQEPVGRAACTDWTDNCVVGRRLEIAGFQMGV